MNKIIVTTESGSDITEKMQETYNIKVVPFSINFPDHSVNDDQIDVEEIYNFYSKTKQIPKTNSVSPYQYTEFFDEIALMYPDYEIIHVGYSSACSSSFQNAMIGIKDCQYAKVHLIDALNVSGGLCNMVLTTIKIIQEHKDMPIEDLLALIKSYIPKIKTSFVPDTLDYLSAGGRVSNKAALGASIFKIKPRIDIINGELIAGKKYLGLMKKVSKEFVADFLKDENFDLEQGYVFFAKGASQSVIDQLINGMKNYGFKNIYVGQIGCVMTVHGGKGAIGLSATRI